ncbi:STRADA isoform 50 [Pongo abelii]|uniref:STE20 related adaptor alpha n=2 Tax=Hominidae TaxID=9604 RepID=A0A1W2PRI8_HUMAN|nr:STRADA isoform 50 [Pongo abelii]
MSFLVSKPERIRESHQKVESNRRRRRIGFTCIECLLYTRPMMRAQSQ